MTELNVVLLLADTQRSFVYVKSLCDENLRVSRVIFYSEDTFAPKSGSTRTYKNFSKTDAVQKNNPPVKMFDYLNKITTNLIVINSSDVNSEAIFTQLQLIDEDLIVFSGYPGQIVKKPLLEVGIPFLHIHCGSLPRYKGSTTIYYELLETNQCAATAILLDEKIDSGRIVGHQFYPKPTRGTDIDFKFDPEIRANLLVKVLKSHYAGNLSFLTQNEKLYFVNTYYVIHPLLKHLAVYGEEGLEMLRSNLKS